MYTLMDFFSGVYISALRGCCSLKFLHTLEIDQGLLAHTRSGTESPPKKKSWKLKISLKIQRARVHNLRNNGSIFIKLFHAICHYCERNFVFLKLILHLDLRHRAASRLALPCPSSLKLFFLATMLWGIQMIINTRRNIYLLTFSCIYSSREPTVR